MSSMKNSAVSPVNTAMERPSDLSSGAGNTE